MRVLLDTHALLWFFADDPRLSRHAHDVIADPATETLVSVASLWEIVVKASVGKLPLAEPFEQLIPPLLKAERIGVLPIHLPHLGALEALPLYHRDPFDRLIAAQAIAEGVPLITRDAAFVQYPVRVVWEAPVSSA